MDASEAQRAVPEVAEFRNALSPEAGKWQSEVVSNSDAFVPSNLTTALIVSIV